MAPAVVRLWRGCATWRSNEATFLSSPYHPVFPSSTRTVLINPSIMNSSSSSSGFLKAIMTLSVFLLVLGDSQSSPSKYVRGGLPSQLPELTSASCSFGTTWRNLGSKDDNALFCLVTIVDEEN
jgi:hypothetical protein